MHNRVTRTTMPLSTKKIHSFWKLAKCFPVQTKENEGKNMNQGSKDRNPLQTGRGDIWGNYSHFKCKFTFQKKCYQEQKILSRAHLRDYIGHGSINADENYFLKHFSQLFSTTFSLRILCRTSRRSTLFDLDSSFSFNRSLMGNCFWKSNGSISVFYEFLNNENNFWNKLHIFWRVQLWIRHLWTNYAPSYVIKGIDFKINKTGMQWLKKLFVTK